MNNSLKIPIFFDFGGTIVDNIEVGRISFNSIFKKNLSVDETKSMYRNMSGKINIKTLFRMPINPISMFLKRKELANLQNELIFQKAQLFPSSREFLFKLKDRNEFVLVIVTQNPQLKSKQFVNSLFSKLFDTNHPFDFILSDFDKVKIIKKHFSADQISKSLFIGDLQNDMNIAKKLGVPGIGVAWGYADGKLKAHHIAKDFDSLYSLIDSHVTSVKNGGKGLLSSN